MNLKEYSLLGTALLAGTSSFNQVKFYHNYDPDRELMGHELDWGGGDYFYYESLALDLNNDGVDDISFQVTGVLTYTGWASDSFWYSAYAVPLNANQILFASLSSQTLCPWGVFDVRNIALFNNGQMIEPIPPSGFFATGGDGDADENNMWQHRRKLSFGASATSCTVDDEYVTAGLWMNKMNKSIPFKFILEGNSYLGWIRLTTSGNYKLKVRDYAISLIPETTIAAGNSDDAVTATGIPVPGTVTVLPTKAKLTWTAVAGAIGYRVRYRPTGTESWIYKDATGTDKVIKSLSCSTGYEWQVQTKVNSDPDFYSAFSAIETFTTSSCRIGEDEEIVTDVQVYPTLASTSVFIKTQSNSENIDMFISLLDIHGNVVKKFITNSENFELDVSDVAAGTYFVSVNNGFEAADVQTIVIAR